MPKRLSEVEPGEVLKLKESGIMTNFVVPQQGTPDASLYVGFEGTTMLLRKEIHSLRPWDADVNDYKNSDITVWLNDPASGYLSQLEESIRALIPNVKIPYRPGSGIGTSISSGENGMQCKVFLLSAKEYGFTTDSLTQEGVPLSYFSDGDSSKTIAEYNGVKEDHWIRSVITTASSSSSYLYFAGIVQSNGVTNSSYLHGESEGVRPAFVLPNTLVVLDDGTITINEPPTAPSSIDVANVGSSGTITITLTAATDPDGTVESYIFERQVDGGEWTQFADVNALTQTDAIGEEWGTVAYRAAAVDNLGLQGPYITGETFTVNSGWTIISGPAEAMGSQPAPFDFAFSVSVTGESDADTITVSAALDGEQVYSGTPSAGAQVTIPIKTHLLGAGTHVIEVQASKDDYLPASKRYTFTVPAVAIPEGGVGALAQGPDGRAVYHTTLAQRCIGTGGVDIQAQVDALTARVKTLEG